MVENFYIKNENNHFVVMGIYKGIRIKLKIFDNEKAAETYIKNGVL